MDAKLKINGKTEINIGEGVFSIGRTSDNFLPLSDANVSRYHAEIESKNGGYTLIELGSANGTTVNGTPLSNQITLKDGDIILFGGSSEVVFNPKEETETPKVEETPQIVEREEVAVIEEVPQSSSKMPLMIGIAAVTVGLAIVAVVAVGLIYFTETKCEATARIISPVDGETISKALEIEVSAKNTECVGRARFELNGEEIATANQTPYTTTLDPAQFPELADGGTYDLQVFLEDKGGKTIQTSVVSVAFDTIEEKPKNTPTPEIVEVKPNQTTPKTSQTSQSRQISLADTQAMYLGIVKQFSGKFVYKPDTQFYQQLQAKTIEYKADGYFTNAQKYSDAIKIAFVQENGLDPAIGYLTAMSRSKFSPIKDKNDEGLWRMTNDFATANAFNGTCGNETLSDASQNCAAKSAAVYLKALILNVFEGDVLYGVSCFGMSPNEASAWKQTLPADRTNFWQTIKTPKQKEEVVKFFAAAIVAENPQKFGLKRDRPISEIYKILMN